MEPSGNPREAWERFARVARQRMAQGGGPGGVGGKPPKGAVGSIVAIVLLGAAGITFNNALFNGMTFSYRRDISAYTNIYAF